MIRRAVVNYLKSNAEVSAVLGGRIYPLEIPKNLKEQPFAFVVASVQRRHTKDGPTGAAQATVQISVWSSRVLDAEEGANVIRKAIDGFRGEMEGLVIRNVRSETESDLDDVIDSVGAYGIGVTYLIDYEE